MGVPLLGCLGAEQTGWNVPCTITTMSEFGIPVGRECALAALRDWSRLAGLGGKSYGLAPVPLVRQRQFPEFVTPLKAENASFQVPASSD